MYYGEKPVNSVTGLGKKAEEPSLWKFLYYSHHGAKWSICGETKVCQEDARNERGWASTRRKPRRLNGSGEACFGLSPCLDSRVKTTYTCVMRTFEYRMRPTKAQEHALMTTLIASRKMYNACLEELITHYKETGK